MARVFDHDNVLEPAKCSSIPVVNGLSDYNHPCQAMANALIIYEEFGNMNGLKLTFLGDDNNVTVLLMHAPLSMGDNFTFASPEGYDIDHKALEIGHKIAERTISNIKLLRDPHLAVKNAQVIYTDTWTSMGQELTNSVADGPHSRLVPRAHNRMHAQKAVVAYLHGAV